MSIWSRTAGFLMAAGIVLGAFGAHALKGSLDPKMMEVYHTAVFYQLVNAVGLLAVSGIWGRTPSRFAGAAGMAITAGILVFSGSLYLMALSGLRWLGAVTPIGGVLLIGGWIGFALTRDREGE